MSIQVPGGAGSSATTVIARVTVVPDDTITIEIGAAGAAGGSAAAVGTIGGNSTFTHASGTGSGSMSTITAPGGQPGLYIATTVAPVAGTVGANNEGLSILGGYGSAGSANDFSVGGSSFWGGGGQGAQNLVQQSKAGTAYGSGGGGGNSQAVGGRENGAAGAAGVCFIMEFK